jgi:phosphatidylglycerophosphatase A
MGLHFQQRHRAVQTVERPPTFLSNAATFIAMGFGAGRLPFSPGTAGAVLGVPLALVLERFGIVSQAAGMIALTAFGIWICGLATRQLQHDDHPSIVFDETLGALLVFLATPPSILSWTVGLIAFRFFDIVKPWPIRAVQSGLSGGLGIVADDLAASIPSIAVVWLLGLIVRI